LSAIGLRSKPKSARTPGSGGPEALHLGIRPPAEEWSRFQQPTRRFVDEGLLETGDGVLRLTKRGALLSNEVFQEFLND